MVPKTKPNVTFQGQGYASTAIVWNDTANSSGGTFYSGSVQVFSDNFIAKNISFMVRKTNLFMMQTILFLVVDMLICTYMCVCVYICIYNTKY